MATSKAKPAPVVESKNNSTAPKFDKDTELFKLNVLSNYMVGRHFTYVCAYLAAYVSVYVLAVTQLGATYGYIAAIIVFFVFLPALVLRQWNYRKRIEKLSVKIKQVQNGETLPDLFPNPSGRAWVIS